MINETKMDFLRERISSSDKAIWLNRGKYWLLDNPQLSSPWTRARIGRVTGSTAGALLSHSKFSSIEETIDSILGLYKKETTYCMARGVMLEPNARRWLSKTIEKNIEEIGLSVPTWDYRIGASVDGLLEDSICEIKIPNAMYKPLIAHREKLAKGISFNTFYHRHIWDSHYDQMQLGMAVTGKKYCYYTVYFPGEDVDIPEDYYVEKIPFNESYWQNMYSTIIEIYDSRIEPRMKKEHIERIDPF